MIRSNRQKAFMRVVHWLEVVGENLPDSKYPVDMSIEFIEGGNIHIRSRWTNIGQVSVSVDEKTAAASFQIEHKAELTESEQVDDAVEGSGLSYLCDYILHNLVWGGSDEPVG